MMTVLNCIVAEHDPWLVVLAAIVCNVGAWATLRLLRRAGDGAGPQRLGWHFLAAVAGGSATWCTHFIAMLGYLPGVPVTYDPALTIASLLLAIAGFLAGFLVSTSGMLRAAPALGGALVGLAVSAMHYTGMVAYRVDGLVSWDAGYLVTSIALATVFGGLAVELALRPGGATRQHAAAALLVAAIVSLHFTAMTAFQVTPLAAGAGATDTSAVQAMALAIAFVGMIVVGSGLTSYLIDSSTRHESVQMLHHMARHDTLTGLPNRASFATQLAADIDAARHGKDFLAVIAIDLDRFKVVNELRGHGVGDAVLRMVGERLLRGVTGGEFVARLGSDEFAAIKRFRARRDLQAFLDRLKAALFQPVQVEDFETTIGASLGVALYPGDAEAAEGLMNNAELAMYRAKADPAHIVCFYDAELDQAVRERRALGEALRAAIEAGALEIHYQVQTQVSDGAIRGYEALLRWRHPVRGNVPPSEFIPLAEESGLILPLGEWVLRQACATAAQWPAPYKVAVNLSAAQFAHRDLPELVRQTLADTGLPPHRLELELTESTLIVDRARSLAILRQIKKLGVNIALDDFGTGYSSLDTLRTFPFDKIKLDRSFTADIATSRQAAAIVRAVLALGHSLDIAVLAEGIETETQLAVLRLEGCDEAQGYLLGRPLPENALAAHGGPAGRATAPAAAMAPAAEGRLTTEDHLPAPPPIGPLLQPGG